MEGRQAVADDGHISEVNAVDEALAAVFPNGLPARPVRGSSVSAIVRTFPLTPEHLQKLAANYESGEVLGVGNGMTAVAQSGGISPARIKRRHHRLAMLMATGTVSDAKAALACGLHPNTVSILRQDPMFAQLLELYSDGVTAEFQETVENMAELADDIVERIRDILDTQENNVTIDQLTKLLPILTDRSGNGPTSNVNNRTVALHLNSRDIADAKADAARGVERPLRKISEEGRRALDSLDPSRRLAVRANASQEGIAAGPGPSLRAQDHRLARQSLFGDEADADAALE